ncbi:coiled-coil domain-containing protein 42-like [Ascaphus truei]|uniref:coiled-coil domain-containing protein 42-like n=1 Tax=Ascaphus truei TaxID=8439 RepID=UPI003F59648C
MSHCLSLSAVSGRVFICTLLCASGQFQEVPDVVSRFHTLVVTSNYLQQGAQEAQGEIERARGRLAHYVEEKSDVVLQLNNQLGQLQNRLEQGHNMCIAWESCWAHIQNTAAKKTLLLGTIKMATLNLFQSISGQGRESVESVAVDDTVRQLELIEQNIRDLSDIWDEVSRRDSKPLRALDTVTDSQRVQPD